MKLVIHAGIHRTGTTSLQRLLARNRAVLAGAGRRLSRARRPNHQPLAWALMRGQSGADEVLALVEAARRPAPGGWCFAARTSRSTRTSAGSRRWRRGTTPGRSSTCAARTTG